MDWRPYTRNPAKFGLVRKDGKWVVPVRDPKPDGPEIFSGFWRPRDQLRKEVVLARHWDDKEIRMKYVLDYIPWTWRDIVCICDPATIGYRPDKIHKNCGKYARWMFRRQCITCLNPWVEDHTHPKKNGLYCYDCLVKKYGVMDSENFFDKTPREPTNLEDRGVFDLPDLPSFDF